LTVQEHAMSLVDQVLARLALDQPEHRQELESLVRIPSVSFDGFDPGEVGRSAEAVADLLRRTGLEQVRLLELEGAHPYVYGEHCHAPGAPTLLLYAHHDVQPPGDASLWRTPPFEPTEVAGRLYGRGTADDKAGLVVHTAAIASWLRTAGRLPVNIKLVVEGEEETGSEHLPQFLAAHRSLLQADVMVLTDTMNFDVGIPGITTSLRGMMPLEVEVRALAGSVHSGMWGGAVPDAAMALSRLLSSLVDEDGALSVPGLCDAVREPTPAERAAMEALPFSEELFRRQAGIVPGATLAGGRGPVWERLWRRPSLAVNAIEASSRPQARNIIVDTAWARLCLRLVPEMQPESCRAALEGHLREKAPWGVEVSVRCGPGNTGWLADTSHPAFAAARRALERGYGRAAELIGNGCSIPFVEPFIEALGAPALLIGVEDPYTNAHGENESLHLGDFAAAQRSAVILYDELSRQE